METALPTHFLHALEKFGMGNVRVVGSRRSRVDLHIEDLLIEAQKDGLAKRGWCYIDQHPEDVVWVEPLTDGTWPQAVDERALW
jgi:hypothetical protein